MYLKKSLGGSLVLKRYFFSRQEKKKLPCTFSRILPRNYGFRIPADKNFSVGFFPVNFSGILKY